MREVDVAIIGSGTAGLSARSEVAKQTDNYVIMDDGILGTTCARVGCMPSKVLIQVANDYHKRLVLHEEGILNAEKMDVDLKHVMRHVRKLRDRFVSSVLSGMPKWEDKFIAKRARFIDRNTLDVGGEQIRAKSIVIGAGSKPILPEAWENYQSYFINTDAFFELEELPKTIAVIGMGVIGMELGQALSRLGVQVIGISRSRALAGLSDPAIQDYMAEKIQSDFELAFGAAEIAGERNGKLVVKVGDKEWEVEKAFLTMGRRSMTKDLNLEALDLPLDTRGIPDFDRNTMQIPNTRIFIAGDVNAERTLLHEAADEGNIAGYNAVRESVQAFKRREFLAITFSDPNVAVVGQSYKELQKNGTDYVTGEVCFEGFGRAIIQLKEKGLMHVYADRKTGTLLGAELFAPSGEHIAHLLSWAMSMNLTVDDCLSLPFYHPVIEEALRRSLRDAAVKLEIKRTALEVQKI